MNGDQKPLELILARNLMASISTPAFLTDEQASLVFFNESAGALLGRRFEETGKLSAEQWTAAFGPFGTDGQAKDIERLPLTIALRRGKPMHSRFTVRSATGDHHDIEVSALPLVGSAGGFRGALAVFWPIETEEAHPGAGEVSES